MRFSSCQTPSALCPEPSIYWNCRTGKAKTRTDSLHASSYNANKHGGYHNNTRILHAANGTPQPSDAILIRHIGPLFTITSRLLVDLTWWWGRVDSLSSSAPLVRWCSVHQIFTLFSLRNPWWASYPGGFRAMNSISCMTRWTMATLLTYLSNNRRLLKWTSLENSFPVSQPMILLIQWVHQFMSANIKAYFIKATPSIRDCYRYISRTSERQSCQDFIDFNHDLGVMYCV